MKFTQVALSFGPSVLNVFTFPLDSTIATSPYVIKSIEGLQPSSVDLSIADTLYEGGVLQGSRPQNKQIVITIGLQPNYSTGQTAGDLRSALYDLLTPKLGSPITVTLSGVVSPVSISGRVKDVQAPIFSKDPDVEITISCLSPYLTGPQYTEPSPGSLTKPFTFTNPGNAPSGFEIKFTINVTASSMSIWPGTFYDDSLIFRVNQSFNPGDTFQFSSVAGNRYVSYIRAGVTYNLLGIKYPGSKWIQLHGGSNTLNFLYTNLTITYFSYTPRYWGV